MHPEAPYWTLLTAADAAADPALADLLAAWLAAGNRSLRDLFELHPDVLAAAMGRSLDDLQPLLRLRSWRLQVERLLDRLARAGVDLLSPWDRSYPRALKEIMPGGIPAPLWYLGPPAILDGKIVAVIGARDSGTEAVDFARAAGGALAAGGKTVLAGVARAVERGALEGATASDGKAIGLLGQGIARALPDLQRLLPRIRGGALLVVGALHPETAWQPGLEEAGNRVLLALAGRVIVAQAGAADSTLGVAARALDAGKPVLVRAAEEEGNRALLERGGMAIAWPPESAEALEAAVLAQPPALVQLLQHAPAARSMREVDEPSTTGASRLADTAHDERPRPATSAATREAMRTARPRPTTPEDRTPEIGANDARRDHPGMLPTPPLPEDSLEGTILRCLQRRKRPMPKGALLQAIAIPESSIDRALAALIAAGRVRERLHRAGTAYELPPAESAPAEARFQLSLFGQEATSDDDQPMPDP